MAERMSEHRFSVIHSRAQMGGMDPDMQREIVDEVLRLRHEASETYSQQAAADEYAEVEWERQAAAAAALRARVARLEEAARNVTECEDDLEDAVLALRAVLDGGAAGP